MIECSNCGAFFETNAPKCPYCGQVYIPGAQREYMQNLQDMKNEMSEVAELSENIYHKEIKNHVKKIKFFVLFFVILFISGVIFFMAMDHFLSSAESEEDIKARILWERENFLILDALYKEEKYSEILVFLENAFEEKGYTCYQWEHYEFIMYYEDYQVFQKIAERCKNGEEVTGHDAEELLYCGMSLLPLEEETGNYGIESLTDTEKEKLQQWKQQVESFFVEELKFTKEEIKEIQDKVYEDGFLSYEFCRKYGKTVLEKIENEMH